MVSKDIQVALLAFSKSSDSDRDSGLLGWIKVEIAGWLVLDGITLRRSRHGQLSISLPARTDKVGNRRPYMRIVDAASRQEFECQVLHALQESRRES